MKLLKILYIIFIFNTILYGENERNDLEDFFYSSYLLSSADQTVCEPSCRIPENTDKYKTKITGFDAITGITTCEVFYKHSGDNARYRLAINANTKAQVCEDEYSDIKVDYVSSDLVSKSYTPPNGVTNISEYVSNKVTMSKFIAGLATLDDDIINISTSVNTGIISKRDPEAIYSLNPTGVDDPNTLLNTIDKLSSENLSYYVDLFYSLDKIYDYIVAYVFVFISVFFMVLYSSKILLKKIAKKTTAFDEPWQSKVAVIVFTTVIFFIPMKLDDKYSSTLFQNMWKYFVSESSSIADRANNIAMQTYLKKVYNKAGASGVKTEANIRQVVEQQEYLKSTYEDSLYSCMELYPNEISFIKSNPNEISNLESMKISSSYTGEEFTYSACKSLEKKYKVAYTTIDQANLSLERMENAYSSSGDINDRLSKMTEHLDKRVQEIGWYSSILAPTLHILTKVSFLQGNDIEALTISESYTAKINTRTEKNLGIGQNNLSYTLQDNESGEDDIKSKTDLANQLGHSAYYMIPGIKPLAEVLKTMNTKELMKSFPNFTKLQDLSTKLKNDTQSEFLAVTLAKELLPYLPFVTTFIAVALVIVMYIYELVIFSFVSPFIVAYSVTTGQGRKILDFLVTALSIFLKPVIIVIAVYLSLFLYDIFNDIFILMADEQFYLSSSSTRDIFPTFMFTYIKEVLYIFAMVAAIFFMWKLIVQMPGFIFKLIGLDNLDNTSQLSNSMQQQFGKFGFRA